MSDAVVFEVFQTANRKTKTGEPRRWRWKAVDADGDQIAKSRHSFKTEAKAIADLELHANIPDGSILRRPGHSDLPLEREPE